MGRRKKRPARPSTHTKPNDRPGETVAPPPGLACDPPRPNRWFLAVSILLMAGWIGFLLFLVFAARRVVG